MRWTCKFCISWRWWCNRIYLLILIEFSIAWRTYKLFRLLLTNTAINFCVINWSHLKAYSTLVKQMTSYLKPFVNPRSAYLSRSFLFLGCQAERSIFRWQRSLPFFGAHTFFDATAAEFQIGPLRGIWKQWQPHRRCSCDYATTRSIFIGLMILYYTYVCFIIYLCG